MSAQDSVNIFNADGSVTVYKKLSERLPDFLEAYPIGEGYRLVSTSQEQLSVSPVLGKLAVILVEKGATFEELQKTISLSGVLFTCELRDESNDVLASASALKKVVHYKDHEIGETAALQRLLAKLGFGGEIFDDDENRDFEDQDLTIGSKEKEQPAAKATVSPISPESKAIEKPLKTAKETVLTDTSEIAPAILRQLKRQAEIAGVPCPDVTTTAEAKAALKKLRS